MDVVARRYENVEVTRRERPALAQPEDPILVAEDLLVLGAAVETDEAPARWSWTGVCAAAGTTSENSASDRSPERNSSHWPMPPPIPLSGTQAWHRWGSQSS